MAEDSDSTDPPRSHRRTQVVVQIIISVVVLAAALYVILEGSYPDKYAMWAFGMVGLVVGYWLR